MRHLKVAGESKSFPAKILNIVPKITVLNFFLQVRPKVVYWQRDGDRVLSGGEGGERVRTKCSLLNDTNTFLDKVVFFLLLSGPH